MTTALEKILLDLPILYKEHKRDSNLYTSLEKIVDLEIKKLFSAKSKIKKPFPPFGDIIFPYFQMGNINSLNLFGLDELIIFMFYWRNKNNYKNVLDLGGNIGLHSIIMDKCGFNVEVYEPDPIHFRQLLKNLEDNNCRSVKPFQAAVSSKSGKMEFVRVLGNTTSSHIKGSKNPYGDLETFLVDVVNFKDIIFHKDLIKMDVEGHEKELLLLMNNLDFNNCDIIVEIGSDINAKSVFNHLMNNNINAFSQKRGWNKIKVIEDMPTSHKEGSLFISKKAKMFW